MSEPVAAPKYSLTAGWICLIGALGAVITCGPLGFLVAGPLLVVCMILSIIGMAKNNTGGGIALLLSSMFLPPVAFVVWLVLLALMSSLSSGNAAVMPATPIASKVPAVVSLA